MNSLRVKLLDKLESPLVAFYEFSYGDLSKKYERITETDLIMYRSNLDDVAIKLAMEWADYNNFKYVEVQYI